MAKYKVTKAPGNGRVFTVTGDIKSLEVGKQLSLDGDDLNSWLLTSKILKIEDYGHAAGITIVKTLNSEYILEKLNE